MNMSTGWEPMKHAEVRIERSSSLSAPVRGTIETDLERLKSRLLIPFLQNIESTSLGKEIAWAANEAAALAWFTVCPILVFPTLLEEKVRSAIFKWEKQNRLFQVSL